MSFGIFLSPQIHTDIVPKNVAYAVNRPHTPHPSLILVSFRILELRDVEAPVGRHLDEHVATLGLDGCGSRKNPERRPVLARHQRKVVFRR